MINRYLTSTSAIAVCFLLMTVGPTSILSGDDKSSETNAATLKKDSSVSGKVLMPDGRTPAAGAEVHLLRRSSNGVYTLPSTTQKTTTNAEGRFSMERVNPGQYKLWAETLKSTSLEKKLGGARVEVGEDGIPVTAEPLTLHDGCNYRLKVFSARTAKPLPGSRVRLGWTDLPRQYQAGVEGVVEIGGLSVGEWYFVVTADGYSTEFKKTPKQPLGSLTELEFQLQPGGEVTGVVQTDQGEPVADAAVTARSAQGGLMPPYGRTETGKDGRFRFKNLPIGRAIRIDAGKDEYVGVSQQVLVSNDPKQATATIICNPRPDGGDCIVSVIDDQGAPIVGANLKNPGNSTADNREATTDEKGNAQLVNMFSSHTRNRVFAPGKGFTSQEIRVFVRAKGFITQEIRVARGTQENPAHETVRMRRGKVLRGQLLTPDDKPASGVSVYYNGGESFRSLGGKVITDKEGQFEIDGLPERSTLTVYSPRPFTPIRNLAVPAGLDAAITIKMNLEAVIRIRAVDKMTGQPIPDFNVRVSHSRERKRGEPRGAISSMYGEEGINILGKQTEFTMKRLVENTPLQVTVTSAGYQTKILPRVLAVRSDQAELLDVALQPGTQETVRGRIEYPNGQPVFGVKVSLIVGKVNPISDRSREHAGPADNWPDYHWESIVSGQIGKSNQFLQVLSTTTDVAGNFVFTDISKDGAWIELFHLGGGAAPARYPNLRETYDDAFEHVNLKAVPASSLTLFVDREKWPTAGRVRLSAPFYMQYPDCIERPFSSETKEIDRVTTQVKFTGLAPGEYQVTVEGRPTAVGKGRFATDLGSYFIKLPTGEEMEGDL